MPRRRTPLPSEFALAPPAHARRFVGTSKPVGLQLCYPQSRPPSSPLGDRPSPQLSIGSSRQRAMSPRANTPGRPPGCGCRGHPNALPIPVGVAECWFSVSTIETSWASWPNCAAHMRRTRHAWDVVSALPLESSRNITDSTSNSLVATSVDGFICDVMAQMSS